MSRPANHISHTDTLSRSPQRHRSGRASRTAPETTDYSSFYGNDRSTPSIIALENLHMRNMDQFTVDSLPPIPYQEKQRQTPIQVFRPEMHSQEGRQLTKVHVSIVFLKIGQIDTVKECFEADLYVQAKWREPVLDRTRTNVSDFCQFWNPDLVIQNITEEPKEKVWHEMFYSEDGLAYIIEKKRIKGKFHETMELNEFPFDIQSISVVLSSALGKDVVDIVEDKRELSNIFVDCFADSQEWELHDFVELEPLDISSQFTRGGKNYSGLVATCCVTRRSGYFAWNVLVIVNLLNIFGFTTFSVKPTLVQNRLQLSFILMLAGISFRFVTNQSNPKISYLTHLDRYVLISMVFSGCITFWHAILTRFEYDRDLQDTLDFGVFIVFAILYFLFQVIFIFYIQYQRRKKTKEIRAKEEKYKEKGRQVGGSYWGPHREEPGSITSPSHRRPR